MLEASRERVWPPLSEAERDEFLAAPRVAVLSVERPKAAPVSVPIWYALIDGEFWLDTIPDSVHGRLMQAAGRATLCIQEEKEPQYYVTAAGPVKFLREEELRARGLSERSVVERLAGRYLDGGQLARWMESARAAFGLKLAVLKPKTVWAASVPPVAEILREFEAGMQ